MTPRESGRHVALIYDAKHPYDINVMSGVAAYLQRSGSRWNVYLEQRDLSRQHLPELRTWRCDGILADLDDPRVASQVLDSRIPAVAWGSGAGWYDPASGIPYFDSDNHAVARLVADHLLERGFRQFAFYGFSKSRITGFSVQRGEAFGRCVRAAGCRLWVNTGPYEGLRKWEVLQRSLRSWLESLPKPIGLMAANDKAAHRVLEACRAGGIRVPEEVAVVGVDNDAMLCQLSHPPLSSVEQGARRVGYRAAELLERMMSGRRPGPRKYVIPPEGIVVRRSSDVMAVADEAIAAALAFIQARAGDGIKVQDVARAMPFSRSQLDRRFRSVVGRTMHDEIRRVRLNQVRRLLLDTPLPLKQIARRCGFRTVQHLTEVFSEIVGVAPGKFRRQHLV
jgi:LacI family transcriptional regulator